MTENGEVYLEQGLHALNKTNKHFSVDGIVKLDCTV